MSSFPCKNYWLHEVWSLLKTAIYLFFLRASGQGTIDRISFTKLMYGKAGRVSSYYDSLVEENAFRGKVFSTLMQNDLIREGDRVLDIGCGTGIFEELAASHFKSASILAIDISPEMLRIAKLKTTSPNIHFVRADFMKLPLFLNMSVKFDCVLSIGINRFVPNANLLFKNLLSLISENGSILLYTLRPTFTTCLKIIVLRTLTLGLFNEGNMYLENLKGEVDRTCYELSVHDFGQEPSAANNYLKGIQIVRISKKANAET